MANKKVSQLVSKPSVLVTDLFPIADPSTGQLYKTTISDLGTAIGSGVSSVNGLVGAVVLDTDDIQELASPTNKWFTDTRARAALSASSPLAYNSGTGVFSIPAATSSQNGYLTSTDWSTFNGKLDPSTAASTYVPYTGATGAVNLGSNNITAGIAIVNQVKAVGSGGLSLNSNNGTQVANLGAGGGANITFYGGLTGTVATFVNTNSGIALGITQSGSTGDGIKITHSAGRAFNIQSSGSGYGILINNETASTSAPFTIQKQGTNKITFSDLGAGIFASGLTAETLDLSNTTAGNALRINHTNTSYHAVSITATGGSALYATGTVTVIGSLTATGVVTAQSGLANGSGQSFALPASTGTLALTSQLSAYLPLSGGTLTGALSGTSATFSSSVTATQFRSTTDNIQAVYMNRSATNKYIGIQYATASVAQWFVGLRENLSSNNYVIYNEQTDVDVFSLNRSTGAATFSSSITATNLFTSYTASYSAEFYRNNGSDSRINITNTTTTTGADKGLMLGEIGVDSYFYNYATGAAIFGTSATERMRITSGGNVGIGTTSPGTALAVNAGTAGSIVSMNSNRTGGGGIIVQNSGSDRLYLGNANWMGVSGEGTGTTSIALASAENSAIIFARNAANSIAETMRITSAGNVGIGTTAPVSKLHIEGTGTGAWLTINRTDTGTNIVDYTQSGTRLGYIGYIGSEMWINNSTTSDISIRTSGTERMRITSGGTIDFNGNTTIGSANDKFALGVNGSSYAWLQSFGGRAIVLNASGNNVLISTTTTNPGQNNTDTGTSFGGGRFFFNNGGTDNIIGRNTDGTLISWRRGGVEVGSVSVTTVATAYNVTSDYRLKEDLKPIKGLELVNKIKVYDYKWKSEDSRMDGVMAHELAEVLPYAVTGVKDGEQMQQVDYSKIVPVMVQAIKELKAELDTLKNK
jgi:hypothetical protein